MRKLLAFFLCSFAASAGYTSKATVTFAAATGSTQNNITLAFSGTDVKLRTVANGGQIQNTVLRAGAIVPADFVLTADATCTTTTGYSWGIESYNATTGNINGWVLIPTLTTSATVAPTICIGNSAVNAYQGGSQGAEFDSYTKGAWHLPDGSSLSAQDFSANNNDGTIHNTATPVAGKLGGAISFAAGSSQYVSTANTLNIAHSTISGWVKLAAYPAGTGTAAGFIFGLLNGISSATNERDLIIDSSGLLTWYVYDGNLKTIVSGSPLGLNQWHYIAGNNDGTTMSLYIDGVQVKSGPCGNGYLGYTVPNFYITGRTGNNPGGTYATFSADEVRLSSSARSADWIATEYANQLNLPVVTSFDSISVQIRTGNNSQGMIF